MKKSDLSQKKIANLQCKDCPSLGKTVLCGLDEEQLEAIDRKKVTRIFNKGDIIFTQNTENVGIYTVKKGMAKIIKTVSVGRESIIRIVSDGDVFGHRSLFAGQDYLASAIALTESVICFIDKKVILDSIRTDTNLMMNFASKLSEELGVSESQSAMLSQKSVFERTCEVLLLLNESYGQKEGERYRLDIVLTREELAAKVGTATENVIRALGELRKRQTIHQEGKTIFIDNHLELIELANIAY